MPAEALAQLGAAPRSIPLTPREVVRLGKDVLQTEARAILRLSCRLDRSFYQAAVLLYHLRGSVIVSGIGKAGLIGTKIAATLASTGTRAHFLHPAEALHGDLGRIGPHDAVVLLTYSGETPEVTQILSTLISQGTSVIAITRSRNSTTGRGATIVLELGQVTEACLLGLAPTSSTAAMLALGDALAMTVSRLRGFQTDDFARYHPGGSLGRRLSRVDDCMRPVEACRVALAGATVREVLVVCSRPGRRSGAIMLTDSLGRLAGLFTDSDLARLFEQHREAALDNPISLVMSSSPWTVSSGTTLEDALSEMGKRKISELPVVDVEGRPLGMLDVTDLMESASHLTHTDQSEPTRALRGPHVRIFPNQDDPLAHS